MSDKWTITYEHPLDDGTTLEIGDTFSLQGERGSRYHYIRTVHNPERDDTWIDCHGGTKGYGQSRSVYPDRIVRVKKKQREE